MTTSSMSFMFTSKADAGQTACRRMWHQLPCACLQLPRGGLRGELGTMTLTQNSAEKVFVRRCKCAACARRNMHPRWNRFRTLSGHCHHRQRPWQMNMPPLHATCMAWHRTFTGLMGCQWPFARLCVALELTVTGATERVPARGILRLC